MRTRKDVQLSLRNVEGKYYAYEVRAGEEILPIHTRPSNIMTSKSEGLGQNSQE